MNGIYNMSDAMNDLLDGTLDDIADLPTFEPFRPGAHRAMCSMELKEFQGHGQIPVVTLTLLETIELTTPLTEDEEPQVEGSQCNSAYFLDNEFGAGKFKALAVNFSEFAGSNKLRDIIEAVVEVEVIVVTSINYGKDDNKKKDMSKVYLDIKEIAVVT